MVITFIRKHLTWLIYLMIIVFGMSVFLMGLGPILSQLGIGGSGALNPARTAAELMGRKFSFLEMENMARMDEARAEQSGMSVNPVMHVAYLSRAVDMLGDRALMLNVYSENGLDYDEAEQNKILDQICTSVLAQVGSKAGQGSGLLAATNKRKACKQEFSRVAEGYSFEQYNQDVVDQLKIKAAVDFITDQEMNGDEKRVKRRLDRIYAKLKGKGEQAFMEEAKKVSEDTGSKTSGGDLGEFGRGRMVKPFEEAAFKTKVGVMTAPVKSDFGYHLIYVYGKKEARGPDFEKEAPVIRQRLLDEKKAKAAENTAANSASKKAPKITVSEKEVREAYETASARHILFKVKSKDALFQAWRNREVSKAVPVLRDPLLNAFRYERRQPPHGKGVADPTERIRLYEKAVEQEPREAVRHYLLCKSYEARYDEAKNKAEQDAAQKTQERMKSLSGSAGLSASVEPVKPAKVATDDLDKALACINKAITLTETPPEVVQGQPATAPQAQVGQYYLLRAQLGQKLGKPAKKLKADAENALAFANGDVSTLYETKSLFDKIGDTEKSAQTQETITKMMEAMQKAAAEQAPAAPSAPEGEKAPSDRGSY